MLAEVAEIVEEDNNSSFVLGYAKPANTLWSLTRVIGLHK